MTTVCRRLFRAVLLITVAACLSLPAFAKAQSSIEGTVTGAGGGWVGAVTVTAYAGCATEAGSSTIDDYGWYQIFLEPGSYCVKFTPMTADPGVPAFGEYVFEWYGDVRIQSLATDIALGADEARMGVDAELERYGAIAGTLTSDYGDIEGEVTVEVYDNGGAIPVVTATVPAPYEYTTPGLLPGSSYKVRFVAPAGWSSQWFHAKNDRASADAVNVQFGLVTGGTDAQLVKIDKPGTVSGTISAAVGEPAGDISVGLHSYSGVCAEESVAIQTVGAAAAYQYVFTGVAAGDYCLFFEPSWDSDFAAEWHDDKRTRETADHFSVTAGGAHTIDAALDRFGGISGTVSSDWGVLDGDVGVEVYAGTTLEPFVQSAITNAAAGYFYTVGNLPAGTDYRVRFAPDDWNWSPQWYQNKDSQNEADPVTVAWGETTTGTDAQLAYIDKPGSISGTVTTADAGTPAGSVTVRASNWSTTRETTVNLGSGSAYTIGGLPADHYVVTFIPPAPYLAEYFNNWFEEYNADYVVVLAGADTPGVDAVLDKSGTIAGRVTSASGQPLVGDVQVAVYQYGGKVKEVTASAANGGAYQVTGLLAGDYQVGFNAVSPIYQPQWYDLKTEEYLADLVGVSLNQTTNGIDAVLATVGSISGKATSATGSPLTGAVNVSVYDAAKTNIVGAAAAVAANGYVYRVNGLAGGTYYVKFEPAAGWSPQWYDRKALQGAATPVVVIGEQNTPDIDASLDSPGVLQGTFTGVPFSEGVRVTVYDENSDLVGQTEASPPGYAYRIELAAGTYYLGFESTPGGCLRLGGPCQGALRATAESGKTTTFDYAVTSWGRISGNVSASAPGAFQGSVAIRAQGPGNGSTHTFGGSYTLDCLAPGPDYKVFFDAEEYRDEWYDDQPDSVHAASVAVAAGQTTGGIDAVLAQGGGISGTVYPEAPSTFTAEVSVQLKSAAETRYDYAYSGNNFTYSFKGLRTGDYTVFFWPSDNHLPMWYQNSPDTPTPVHVTEGSIRTGIDTTLPVAPPLGKITGTVTDESDASLGYNVMVIVYDSVGRYVSVTGIDATTNVYEVADLAAGDYYVLFSAGGGCPLYVSEWYDNASSMATATQVHVTAGGAPATANAKLAKLPAPGRIEGDVTLGGKRIDWQTEVQVFVYDSAQLQVASDYLGFCSSHYNVCVPPGSYKVKFVASGVTFAVQWYNGKPSEVTADTVVVEAGGTRSRIDADLAPRAENQAPVLAPIGNKTVREGQSLQFTLSGSDLDGDTLTFSATNLPAWADYDPFTRQVTLQPPVGSAGDYPGVVFTVSDSALTDTETIAITVTSAAVNRAPVLDPIGNKTVPEGQKLQFTISGSDLDAGNTLTFSATNLPAWATFDPVTRMLAGTPGYRGAGVYATVTFTVSDGALTDTETITITVSNRNPFFIDTFSTASATGDADWAVRMGAWSVGADKTLAARPTKNDLATVNVFDGALRAFTVGTLSADIKLAGGKTPGGYIVFAWEDNSHYRYAGIVKGKVVIGQVGAIGATAPGVWSKPYAIGLQKYAVKVVVLGTGVVDLYIGTRKIHTKRFAGPPPAAGIGVLSKMSQTFFDNFKAGN